MKSSREPATSMPMDRLVLGGGATADDLTAFISEVGEAASNEEVSRATLGALQQLLPVSEGGVRFDASSEPREPSSEDGHTSLSSVVVASGSTVHGHLLLSALPGVTAPVWQLHLATARLLAQVAALRLTCILEQQILHDWLNTAWDLALYDPLTGLANRMLLKDRARLTLRGLEARERRVVVLYCDLDSFKTINDRHGHHVGDAVLIAVAERLRAAVRPDDTVARVGGDEFVALCQEPVSAPGAAALVARVTAQFARPMSIEGIDHVVTLSVGSAMAPEDGGDLDALLRVADAAMMRRKPHTERRRGDVVSITLPSNPILPDRVAPGHER